MPMGAFHFSFAALSSGPSTSQLSAGKKSSGELSLYFVQTFLQPLVVDFENCRELCIASKPAKGQSRQDEELKLQVDSCGRKIIV